MNNKKPSYEELLELYEKQGRRFEKVLKLSDSQARRLVHMTEEKLNVLSGLSHEIRTPLNAIIGFSQILQNSENMQEQHKTYIEKINSSGNQLLRLINSILDLSKIEAQQVNIEKINFDLHKTVDTVINQVELKAQEKGLNLSVIYADDVDSVFKGDSLRLSQILTNLLNNAVKFTDIGSVTISISKVRSNRYKFSVQDTGIGLDEKQISKLFKPFAQADDSTTRHYGGTGLGLTISKELVKLMDGRIWIESKSGVGSTFIFEIALEESVESVESVDEFSVKQEDMERLKNKKILLVEDNKTNQLVFTSILEDTLLDIDIANNGQEAVDMFKPDKYELILMDLDMPVLNGYKASKMIKAIDKNIPIIALTANVMQEDIEKTKLAGIDEHLRKPIELESLYGALLKYIQ